MKNPTISKTKNVTKEYYKLTYECHWWNGMLRKENVSVNGRFTKKNFWYLFSLGGNKERRLWGFPWLFFVSFVCLNTNSILDTPVVRVNQKTSAETVSLSYQINSVIYLICKSYMRTLFWKPNWFHFQNYPYNWNNCISSSNKLWVTFQTTNIGSCVWKLHLR